MSVSLRLENGSLAPSTPHALFPLQVIDSDVSPYDAARDGQRFLALGFCRFSQSKRRRRRAVKPPNRPGSQLRQPFHPALRKPSTM
jgi:hypothetical protein